MDTKHIHCMLEDMAEYGKEMISCAVGSGNVNLDDAGKIIDIVKDLADAEYHALIAKEMRKAHEEEEEEKKYMLHMLKEEHSDEYKRMREEYGDDEGERRFYDNYRYKRTGEFAPKGRGTYMPRRGRRSYVEPMLHMPEEMMGGYDMEALRDMDRDKFGRMYYTDGLDMDKMRKGNMGDFPANMDRNVRTYTDGYNDGYSEGEKIGRKSGGASRYDNAKRGYSESKQQHRGNTQEDNSENMRNLEKLLNIISEDVKEYAPNMSPSEKAMAKQKIENMAKSIA